MSDALPWFRCFAAALIDALVGLPPAEGNVYTMALLRIYEKGGPTTDGVYELSRRTGLPKRTTTKALAALVAKGKLVILEDGRLDAPSTHDELQWQREHIAQRKAAGTASGRVRAEKKARSRPHGAKPAKVRSEKSTASDLAEKPQGNQQTDATAVQRPLDERSQTPDNRDLPNGRSPLAPKGERGGGKVIEVDESFDRFWQVYDHDYGKETARAHFPLVLDLLDRDGTSFEAFLEAARQAREVQSTHSRRTNASKWLAGKHWKDGHTTAAPRSAAQPSALAQHMRRKYGGNP